MPRTGPFDSLLYPEDRVSKAMSHSGAAPRKDGKAVVMEAFTKKHYIVIADALKTSTNIPQLALKLADIFAADNPQFDRARFLTAAGAD